jgi:microcystin degradation protein MlrC
MRIAIAGISHEALNFSPLVTTMKDLWVMRGPAILEYPGVDPMLQARGIEPVPILVANSLVPSGFFEEATYLQLRAEIAEGLEKAGPLDGICLVLHGAMLVENIWSGETDLVRSVRAVVGDEIPIAARLDLHANLTDEFANKVQTWAGFRTAPHRDASETLARTFDLLVRIVQEGLCPQPVLVRVPLLLQGEKATTRVEPMKSLLAMAREIESQPGILNAEVLVGFGWADASHVSANVAVIAESAEHLSRAQTEARRLALAMWDQREAFTFDQEVASSIDEGIDRALQAPERTVFLTDSGDNPTAGATGDTTLFLSRLLERGVPDAVLAGIPDAEAARVCFEAGRGTTVRLSLGGKMDRLHGEPVELTATVEHLYCPPDSEDGIGGLSMPDHGWSPFDAAAMATVRAGGVRVIITDIRKAFATLQDFQRAGIDPLEHKIVVVKLGYLMPELRDTALREILVLSPGYADMELTRLPYEHVTRPIYPLDLDFEWHPGS